MASSRSEKTAKSASSIQDFPCKWAPLEDKGKSKSLTVKASVETGFTGGKSGEKVSSFEKELLENASTMPGADSPLKRKLRVKMIKNPTSPPAPSGGVGEIPEKTLDVTKTSDPAGGKHISTRKLTA
jgi:hypothetical protein